MQFGIFYEHQLPRPWREDGELRLVQEALEQVELADRLGLDYAWEVEHHFLEEYSHSSAPGGLPRRGEPADEAHPARARHRAHAARLQPSGPRRRAHRHARPGVRRARRVRHRRVRLADGARGLRHRPDAEARHVAGGGGRGGAHALAVALPRAPTGRTSRCRRATCSRSRCRSRTRRCGSRARRDP